MTTAKHPKKALLKPLVVVLCLFLYGKGASQEQTGARAQWFVDARYGMFIHWGVYSGAEGFWKGEKLRNDNDYAEWIQYRNRIDKKDYLGLLNRFDWESIDPEEWVLLAKAGGMKYITITAKHHDGFALWNSAASDYNIYNYSKPKRDIIKELAAACKKHGLKLGLYYSHWIDWEHPDAWDHTKELTGLDPKKYNRYWQEKVLPQMKELLTQYGDIGMIWFDMWIHHSKTVVTKEQLFQLKNLIRKYQPNCLINSRLGLSIEEDQDIDFRTLGDNELGEEKRDYPWQTPATVAHSWGFHAGDSQWKSTTTLLKSLIGNVSRNGNFMLNIGPRANGAVPFEIESRLNTIGIWLKTNGTALYKSRAFDLPSALHDWGTITYKEEKPQNIKVFLHVFNWPLKQEIKVTGITTAPKKIYALADPRSKPLPFVHHQAVTSIGLDKVVRNPYITVLVMEFDQKPQTLNGLVAENSRGGYAFNFNNAFTAKGNGLQKEKERSGTIPAHLLVHEQQTFLWKVNIDRPGRYSFDTSYSLQNSQPSGTITLKTNQKSWTQPLNPTGKTVGEPLQNWVVENFNAVHIAEVSFEKAGVYEVELQLNPSKDAPLQWQWLWLQPIKN